MDSRRTRIFAIISLLFLAIVLTRLATLQLADRQLIQERIRRLKEQRGRTEALGTVRGRILDRKGRILAFDQAVFRLKVAYELTQYVDPNVIVAKRIAAAQTTNKEKTLANLDQTVRNNRAALELVVTKCSRFGDPCDLIWERIYRYNRQIWLQRLFQAWRQNCPDSRLYQQNVGKIHTLNLFDALRDLEAHWPDPNDRIRLAGQVRISPMLGSVGLVELRTDEDVLAAELEFARMKAVTIVPEPVRIYPYGSTAQQLIGWVGPATQPHEVELFADDPQRRYQQADTCGKEDGIEYVCEAWLRGRRGRLIYDVDGALIGQLANRLGRDVQLTIDIELQAAVERLISQALSSSACGPGAAAVVIDVQSSQILVMASLPSFDLEQIRSNYSQLAKDPNQPLLNRALNKQYPAGSVVKPLILAAALQLGLIGPEETIPCPSQPAPEGWPNCSIYRQQQRGHDSLWTNNARNAIRGSCNIYFSRLADMIEPDKLQQWLWAFGLGHQVDLGNPDCPDPNDLAVIQANPRRLRQAPGQISTRPVYNRWIERFEQLPPLSKKDLRLVGIGQGNCWVTPIQVAAAMAAIACHGVYRPARLLFGSQSSGQVDLRIDRRWLDVILDGLSAAVNEIHGTAYEAFKDCPLRARGIMIFGKTGSTQAPANAWFAGFAQDGFGHCIALAVVVEGGTSGANDAAPIGRMIIEQAAQAGYLGS